MATAIMGLSLLIPAAPAGASPNSERPTTDPRAVLQLRTAGGSGCPAGTTTVASTASGDAFTLLFDAFIAKGGEFKNCQVLIKVAVPSGWSYTVYQVDNRGFALLDPGATGTLQMTTYFTGLPGTTKETKTISGPYSDAWQTTTIAGSEQWSPCNTDRYLNVNDVITVSGPSTSSMAMFSKDVDVSISSIFRLRWRTC